MYGQRTTRMTRIKKTKQIFLGFHGKRRYGVERRCATQPSRVAIPSYPTTHDFVSVRINGVGIAFLRASVTFCLTFIDSTLVMLYSTDTGCAAAVKSYGADSPRVRCIWYIMCSGTAYLTQRTWVHVRPDGEWKQNGEGMAKDCTRVFIERRV